MTSLECLVAAVVVVVVFVVVLVVFVTVVALVDVDEAVVDVLAGGVPQPYSNTTQVVSPINANTWRTA